MSELQMTSIDQRCNRKVAQTLSRRGANVREKKERQKNKINKNGRRMDSVFARSSVEQPPGRKRVITLVNLLDVFERRKEIGCPGDGILSIVQRGRLVSLVNSYYNWRDCSNARKSRSATIRRCDSLGSLKSRRHLYKSCDGRLRAYVWLKFYRST